VKDQNKAFALAAVAGAIIATGAGLIGTHTISTSQRGMPPALTTTTTTSLTGEVDDPVPPRTPDAVTAAGWLSELARAKPGATREYDRKLFLPGARGWADPDLNGCDGREDAIASWLHAKVERGHCASSGPVADVYTGQSIMLPGDADVDHVVPLHEAWLSGASRWDDASRWVTFGHDLSNLIPVLSSANRAKGDKTPDRWMPSNDGYWCEYGRVYVGVKHTYGLTVTVAEGEALGLALETCGHR
jgi:hypothetical protein